jgi:8-oxo-dGTP pyrophosphatase MutT (NUDIX family)
VVIASEKPLRQLVVGVVLLRDDGAALLQHRDEIETISDPGLWVFPGGHVEAGEAPYAGAVRELEEETCYRCGRLRLLTRLSVPEGELVFFWEEYDRRQPVECREGQALRFIPREEVEKLPRRDYLTRVWDMGLKARAALGFHSPAPANP